MENTSQALAWKGRYDASRGCHWTGHPGRVIRGELELKHSPDFPKKDATPVRLRHFTDEQRLFLISRGETGGYCWVLWQIKRDYFLFDHTVVWQLGDLPKQGLLDHAYRHWTPKLDTETLIEALQVRIQ
jgi:hypothetical protein